MKTVTTEKIREKIEPQTRIDLKKQSESDYEIARALLKTKQYKEAMKRFKRVFATEQNERSFLFESQIRQLVKNYGPSKVIIKRWRNDKEKLIIAQKADRQLIQQWDALNRGLGEKERTLKIFLQLSATSCNEQLLHAMQNAIWKRLAVLKKYELLKSYLPTLGFHLLLHAIEYDSAILFPTHMQMSKLELKRSLARNKEHILETGPIAYEVAIGLGETRVADVFARKILAMETTDRVYASLIKGAIRAKAFTEAALLFKEAQEVFTRRQLRHTIMTLKSMPKSKLALLS